MTDAARIPADPEGRVWDVVVVGTGAGGATAGFNLSRLGRSVLFLERGRRLPGGNGVRSAPSNGDEEPAGDSGWWPHEVYQSTPEGEMLRPVPIGCGAGGSTALFAMVMDRFRRLDLLPSRFAETAAGTSLPESWPIAYEELEPCYREAEALFRVRGTDDPLYPAGGPLLEPGPPSEVESAVVEALGRAGLHPYRIHYAREQVPGCTGCPGRLCPRECRNDAGRICLAPALQHHGAYVLPGCRVVRLRASGDTVREAACLWNGRALAIRGRVFVLALNSFLTPALLLRSATAEWPEGLGNRSGLVGRNLMLHVSDSLLVRFDGLRGLLNTQMNHGIALNDFYVSDGVKLGNVHAHAAHYPGASGAAGMAVFQTIVEDFPYPANRVVPKGDGDAAVVWSYDYPEELRARSRRLVELFAAALGGARGVVPLQPPGTLNIAHACGTCRFGDDPRTSVLDRDNRLHDLDNAYVVDSSFLPSSSGIHPSLTVVANSLRVSALIAQRWNGSTLSGPERCES